MPFNSRYYHDDALHQLRPANRAFSTYVTSDNIVIGIFQGSRGQRPHLDFIVRVLFEGEENKPFAPPHTFWVVDLMLKCVEYSKDVKQIIQYYQRFYDQCEPFKTVEERVNYDLKSISDIHEGFSHLDDRMSLSIDYVATIIELFCLNERLSDNAYMFRNLLTMIYEYADGAANYIQLLQAAKPGFR